MADDYSTSYTAQGPSERGFQATSPNIKVGVFTFGEKVGVWGFTDNGTGVKGEAKVNGNGVEGQSRTDHGVFGHTVGSEGNNFGSGVFGWSINGPGVKGFNGSRLPHDSRSTINSVEVGGLFQSNFAQIRLEPADSLSIGEGHPTSGEHKKGEFFVDKNGALFYCIEDFVPGDRAKLEPGDAGNWRGLALRPNKNTNGPPTTGRHTAGEFYVDGRKRLYFCVEDSAPTGYSPAHGEWKEVRLEGHSWLEILADRLGIGSLFRQRGSRSSP